LWQFVDMKNTKSEELRARVNREIKFAVDKQAEAELLDHQDIVRKAVVDYLVRVKSPFITNGHLQPGS